MPLISYSDSESDAEPKESVPQQQPCQHDPPSNPTKKRKAEEDQPDPNPTSTAKKAPPLPPSFHSLYATNVRTSTADDPSLHGGRKRQVTHVVGNWPSHVYLEWLPNRTQLSRLDSLILRVQQVLNSANSSTTSSKNVASTSSVTRSDSVQLTSFLRSPLSVQLPLHVSLSAPLVLSASTKDLFRDRLTSAIISTGVGEMRLRAVSLDLVPNLEGSRWFLVLRVREDADSEGKLERLLRVCNNVCEGFGLARLYHQGSGIGVQVDDAEDGVVRKKGPSVVESVQVNSIGDGKEDVKNAFHISIAWMLSGVSEEVRQVVKQTGLHGLEEEMIGCDRVKVKIGNVVDDVML